MFAACCHRNKHTFCVVTLNLEGYWQNVKKKRFASDLPARHSDLHLNITSCVKNIFYVVALVLFFVSSQNSIVANGRSLNSIAKKPNPNDGVATARWLVSQNFWGVLNKIHSSLLCFIAVLYLTGKLKLIDEKSKEAEFGRNALFSKHSEMKGWPKDHHFDVYKLGIDNIFLIDRFGGSVPITVKQYLQPKI
ncbi:hypothetical protein RIF29_18862 [Crotalaria pallida]|uniref:CREG-like beta-barrel domain-containing protein n=1 Tax=Crotalaria pallida TaxID=3830 RepID=A0AAN9F2X0_CROPI